MASQRIEDGTRVLLREGDGEERTVIVTSWGRPRFEHVAPESPLGQALMGRRAGDAVTVELGFGLPDRRVTIVAVRQASEGAVPR